MNKKINIAGYCGLFEFKDPDNALFGYQSETSIEIQKLIIRDYVEQNFPDAELTFFEDRNESGFTFDEREGYQEMRPLLMNGTYDILIVKDFSCFSRRNSRGLIELDDLRNQGVRIISIGEGIDCPEHDDWTTVSIRFLLNEMPKGSTLKV